MTVYLEDRRRGPVERIPRLMEGYHFMFRGALDIAGLFRRRRGALQTGYYADRAPSGATVKSRVWCQV